MEASPAAGEGLLSNESRALFGSQWSPWVGGILLGMLNVLMFAYAKPWGVAEGVGNWGNWALLGVGVPVGYQSPPWLFTTSVTNLGLIFGGLIAALLSRQFVFRLTTPRDMARALFGGILLGIGSVLGMGCTIGGFFTAFASLSLAGPFFMVGLLGGAYLGLRLLSWDVGREAPRPAKLQPPPPPGAVDWRAHQPLIGSLLLLAAAAWLISDATEFTYAGITGKRSVLAFFGIALGIVSQRTRFCFARAFREPFMTGDGSMTKAAALALLVALIGFSVIKGSDLADLRDVEEFVNPSVWLGSVAGGLIFGVGMVLTGGCASGSLWRVGEGQFKFIVVLAAFALTNAGLGFYLRVSRARTAWGEEAYFLPKLIGWPGAILGLAALLVVWYLLAAWNEKSEKLVVP